MVLRDDRTYAGWAFDQEGIVRDVPASVNKVQPADLITIHNFATSSIKPFTTLRRRSAA
jgi:hypothetical protein